jgi:hypothetical protein
MRRRSSQSLLQVKPNQTQEQIKKQGYVTYIYKGKEHNIPNSALDCCDCQGDVLDYIKECRHPDRYEDTDEETD